jgi:hypothetical protein
LVQEYTLGNLLEGDAEVFLNMAKIFHLELLVKKILQPLDERGTASSDEQIINIDHKDKCLPFLMYVIHVSII